MVKIISFGFKYGTPEPHNRLVDCRVLRNPHNVPGLKPLTGRDEAVQEYVRQDRKYTRLLDVAETGVKSSDIIAIGCFGGRHRSVAVAEAVAKDLAECGFEVELEHRELGIKEKL